MQTTLPLLIVILLAVAGGLLMVYARRHQYHEVVMSRLHAYELQDRGSTRQFHTSEFWKTLLRRAGLAPRISTVLVIIAGLIIAGFMGWSLYGVVGVVVGVLCGFLGVLLAGYIAVRRYHRQLLIELPSLLDLIIRSLKTGNSLAGAFREAAAEITGALGPVVQQAVRYMDLGYDVGEALTEVAHVHRLRELSIMALAIRVNTHYGGSAVEILQSLIEIIHRRDRIRRQLRALTSETRFSAIVLGAMPILIGGYMVAINPEYILTLWNHDQGAWIMIGALLWQLLGLIILWRMVRSLG